MSERETRDRAVSESCLNQLLRDSATRTTMSEWHLSGRQHYDVTRDKGILAERILKLSDAMRDNIQEVIMRNKRETDMRLEARISDIQQAKFELEDLSACVQYELEVLDLLRERIRDGIKIIKGKALTITEKCILLREQRRGVDLTHDEVEKELEAELKKIKGAIQILDKCLEQNEETMRLLRSSLYMITKDINDKAGVLAIEFDVLNVKETSLNLMRPTGDTPIDVSKISLPEWSRYTEDIMSSSWKRIHASRTFDTHVKLILKEVIEDLRRQKEAVDAAFQRRITEVKGAKARLQSEHYEITKQVDDMNLNISKLNIAIREKEAFLAVAHTRLEKRAHRRGIESVKDDVEATLVKEIFDIKHLLGKLQKMEAEATASLRALLKTQLQLEDAINIKTHSIKIDEVDCMSVRQGLDYHDV